MDRIELKKAIEEGLTLEQFLKNYEQEEHWALRRTYAEVKREVQLDRVHDEAPIAATPSMTKRGIEAMQAGWARPIILNFDTLPPTEPLFAPNGWRVGIISDLHYGDHDVHAIDVMFQICRAAGINELLINGDLFHCASLAKYAPSGDQHLRWVDERTEALKEIVKIRQNFPDIRIRLILGNHDDRPLRWINLNAVPLQNLFTISQWLGIDDPNLGFELVEEGRVFLADGNLMVKHGTSVAKDAGASVRKEIDKAGCSVIMGHVHRRALIEVTKTAHELTGVELGCLCNLRPDYLQTEDTANWQQGFAIVTEYEGGEFNVDLVKIKDGKADFWGKRFVSRIPKED